MCILVDKICGFISRGTDGVMLTVWCTESMGALHLGGIIVGSLSNNGKKSRAKLRRRSVYRRRYPGVHRWMRNMRIWMGQGRTCRI